MQILLLYCGGGQVSLWIALGAKWGSLFLHQKIYRHCDSTDIFFYFISLSRSRRVSSSLFVSLNYITSVTLGRKPALSVVYCFRTPNHEASSPNSPIILMITLRSSISDPFLRIVLTSIIRAEST